MADVFISYKRRVRPQVERLSQALESLELTVWYDKSLMPSDSFSDEISKALREASAAIVCWTNDCFGHGGDKKGWVRGEAKVAQERRTLVPILIEPADLDPPWNEIHTLSLTGWFASEEPSLLSGDGWDELLRVLGDKTGRPGLAGYVQAANSGDLSRLRNWAKTFPDDPLAAKVWQRIEQIEIEGVRRKLEEEKAAKPKVETRSGAYGLDGATGTTKPPGEPTEQSGSIRTFAPLIVGLLIIAAIIVFSMGGRREPVVNVPMVDPVATDPADANAAPAAAPAAEAPAPATTEPAPADPTAAPAEAPAPIEAAPAAPETAPAEPEFVPPAPEAAPAAPEAAPAAPAP